MPIVKSSPWAQQDAINVSLYNRTITGPNRYVTSGEMTAGIPAVTSLVGGSNIILQPATITTTGSVGLANSIVVLGLQVSGGVRTYGDSSDRLQIGDGFSGNTGSTFYGNAADGAGYSWYLSGSGLVQLGPIGFNREAFARARPIYQGTIASAAGRYIVSGELAGLVGVGTVTNIALGSNLIMQPSPITTTGSIGLANSLSIPGDVQVSGTTRFYGSVGVGITPTVALEVAGTIRSNWGTSVAIGTDPGRNRIQGYSSGPSIRFLDTGDAYAALGVGHLSVGDYATTDPGFGNLIVQGNVGIGTDTPGTKLDVAGTGRFSSDVQISGALLTYGNAHDTVQVGLLAVAGGGQSFYGNAGDNIGNSWYLTGSGWLQGTTVIKGNLATDTLTVQVPATFQKPIYANSVTGPNRFLPSGELSAVGTGTVTNIALGSNLIMQPSPITTTGSIGLSNSPSVTSIDAQGLASLSVPAPGIGRLTLSNTQLGGTARSAYLSAYCNAGTPETGSLMLQLIGGPDYERFDIANVNADSRFEFHCSGTLDGYLVIGGANFGPSLPGVNGAIVTQWDAQRVGGAGPLKLILGLSSSSSVVPYVNGVTLSPVMTGATVTRANVGIGTATPGVALDIAGDITVSGTAFHYGPIYNRRVLSANRYVTSGDLAGVPSTGTVTNIALGSNLAMQPSPLTVTGSVGLANSLNIPGDVQVSGKFGLYGTVLTPIVASIIPVAATSANKVTITLDTSAAGGSYYGYDATVRTAASTPQDLTAGHLFGSYNLAQHRGASSSEVNELYGTSTSANNTGGGTVQSAFGTFAGVRNTSSGTINNGYGIYVGQVDGLSNYGVYQAYASNTNYWAGRHNFSNDIQISGTTLAYGNLGVGGLPTVPIHVQGDNAATSMQIESSQSGYGALATLYRYRGTQTAKTAVSGGDLLGNLTIGGYDLSGNATFATQLRGYVDGVVTGGGVMPSRLVTYVQDPVGATTERIAALSTGVRLTGSTQISGASLVYGPIFANMQTGPNRYLPSGEFTALTGTGTVTNIALGSNLAMQPSPITTTGSIGLANSLSIPGDVQVSGAAGLYGSVGIGTATPAGKLQVTDNADGAREILTLQGVYGNNALKSIKFRDASNVVGALSTVYNPTSNTVDFQFNSQYNAGYVAASTATVTIKGDGNVGISTTTPGTKLDVAGSTTISGTTTVYGPIYDAQTNSRYVTSGELSQRKRVVTQFNATTGTLADVTGLAVSVAAGGSYKFEAGLHINASAIGGSYYAISGTATASALIAEVMLFNNGAPGTLAFTNRHTLLSQATGESGTTAGYAKMSGLITVNTSGTLVPYFAQNTANGTSSVLVGSTFVVDPIP